MEDNIKPMPLPPAIVPHKIGIMMCSKVRLTAKDTVEQCCLCEQECFKVPETYRSVEDFEKGKTADLSDYKTRLVCDMCILIIIHQFQKNMEAVADIQRRSQMIQKNPDGSLRINL